MHAWKLIFTPEAREDVTAAAKYYDDQLKGLGKIFRKEVKRQLILLKQNPFTRSCDTIPSGLRCLTNSLIPYIIPSTIIPYPCMPYCATTGTQWSFG